MRSALAAALFLALAAPAGSHPGHAPPTVQVGLYEFKPSTITVVAGDIVQWQWAGPDVNHSVTSDDGSGEKFDSGVMDAEGDSFTYYFGKAGTYAYHCRVHSSMHGTVVVKPGAEVDTTPPTISHLRARLHRRAAVLDFRITERAGVTLRSRRRGAERSHRSFSFVRKGPARLRVGLGRRGRYRITLSAQDSTGNTSKTVAVSVRR